jgi:hypothetical protein
MVGECGVVWCEERGWELRMKLQAIFEVVKRRERRGTEVLC